MQTGGGVGDGKEVLDLEDVCKTLEFLEPEKEAVTDDPVELLALEPGDDDIDDNVIPSLVPSSQNANGIVVPLITVVGTPAIADTLILEILASADIGQAPTTVDETVVVISHPDVVTV